MVQSINKQQVVQKNLARELLTMHLEGLDRLPPVKQFAKDYGVGTGTVQGALQNLKDEGAIELQACGAQGTFLASVSQRHLFDACRYDEFTCLMPLDDSGRIRGLATGIYEAIAALDLPIHILFARGSRNRVKMVTQGKCDFAVMSRLSYETALDKQGDILECVGAVGEHPGDMGVVTRRDTPFIPGVTPVAFDDHSYDQCAVYESLGLPVVKREDCLGVRMVDMVAKGELDAALCQRALLKNDALVFHPLRLPEGMIAKMREAVVVIKPSDDALGRLLKSTLKRETVLSIQQGVLSGERFVKY